MFIDETILEIQAGKGGSGCMSFLRDKTTAMGGPNGGDGGKGGDVIILGDKNLHTLLDSKFKRIYKAQRGRHGEGSDKTGKGGHDIILKVPLGTVLKVDDKFVAEILEDGEKYVAAKGGDGGRGNARFATPTNRAPRKWEPGWPGDQKIINFELKLLADIGLVGFPNAGKSTLISSISAAKPKIADYPFTTLIPNLGIVDAGDFRSFVMADIPGLIEGAHVGKGLGHQFLKHVERTKCLLFLIDIDDLEPEETYTTLLNELRSYNPEIAEKRKRIIITKHDILPEAEFPKKICGIKVLPISSVSRSGLKQLVRECITIIDEASKEEY